MDKESVKKYKEELSKASSETKDLVIASLMWIVDDHSDTLKKVIKILDAIVDENPKNKKLNKEIKEIEDTLSVGIPGWVKFTRKTKKKKT